MRLPLWAHLFASALLAGCVGTEQDAPSVLPRADLEVPRVKTQTGQPLAARLVVLHPEDAEPVPEYQPEEAGLTLLNKSRSGTQDLPGSLARTIFTYSLAAYVPGPVEIGPIKVRFKGRAEPLETQKVMVEILDPLAPETRIDLSSLRPPKGPLPVPRRGVRRLLAYGIGGALLVLAAAAIYFILRKRRQAAPEPGLSCEEQALQKLNTLAEAIPASDDLQLLYYEMNMVLRRYIEQRFGLLAARQTSEEFLSAARNSLPQILQEGLEGYLSHCDMVKYAHAPADRPEAERAVEKARRFVIEAGKIVERQKRLQAAQPGRPRAAGTAAAGNHAAGG